MKTNLPSRGVAKLDSRFHTLFLVCLVAIVCYQADRLAYVLGIPPDHIASFFPSTPFLVAVLLLVPRRIWPILIAAGLGAMVLADLQNSEPLGSTIWFSLGNLVEALIATLGISRFKEAPDLSSVKALAKYLAVTVVLAPFASAFLGATGSAPGGYWLGWRLWFFSDALGFLTVTPAVFTWANEGRAWARQSRNYLELAALMASLILFGYLTFVGTEGIEPQPALLYSLVPLLLWASLRLGLKGVSTSTLVIAILATWGAAHDRGPFAGGGPLHNAVSLQVFLFFAAIPFMFLAVIVEEQKRVQRALSDEGTKLAEAQRLVQMGTWQRDLKTGTVTWSEELYRIAGRDPNLPTPSYKELAQLFSRESWERLQPAIEESSNSGRAYDLDVEIVRPDGTTGWVRTRGEGKRDAAGRIVSVYGTAKDITERKVAEKALQKSEERFRMAAEAGKMFAYEWNASTDVITRSEGVIHVLGEGEGTLTTGQKILAMIPPEDRERLAAAVAQLSPEEPYLRISYRMVRADGKVIWVERNSRAHFDEHGKMLRLVGMIVDITERKLAEEALRQKDTDLSEAQRLARVGSWQWDIQNDIAIWSEELYRIAGLDPRLPAPNYKECPSLLSAESWERLQRAAEATLRDGRSYELDMEMVRPDGTTRWITARGEAVRDTTGRIVRLRGTTQDITERKLAEEALRASRAQLQAIWNNSPASMFLKDRQGRYIDHNPPFSEKISLPREQILGKTDEELFPAEQAATFRANDLLILEGNRATECEETMEQVDGIHTSIVQKFPLCDAQGQPYAICGIVTDITDRKRAEAALQESEDKLRLLLDSTAEAIYGVDLEGRCTFCNPACLRILGYERVDELLGKNAHGLIHHTRADGRPFPLSECRIFGALGTGEGVHVDDEILWKANGTSFPAEYWSYPQRRGQEVVGAVVTFIDITQRKLAEEALVGMSRRLIEAQERERTRIARELHDDFVQRLTLLSLELQGMKAVLPDSAVELRSRMDDVERRASEISTDVQALSHELHSSKLEYVGLAAAMRSFCTELAEKQKVGVDFIHEGIPPNVPQETSLCLFRVMQEALHNAVKHSGVVHFEVMVQGSPTEIHLTVRDSGVGFDPELAGSGRGLGLVSMRERANMVKGTFSITSRPQFGAEVSVRVPVSAEIQTEEAKSAGA